jgi:hypothetical protein
LSVLVDRCRRNASLNDFAEETTHNGNSVQEPQLPCTRSTPDSPYPISENLAQKVRRPGEKGDDKIVALRGSTLRQDSPQQIPGCDLAPINPALRKLVRLLRNKLCENRSCYPA